MNDQQNGQQGDSIFVILAIKTPVFILGAAIGMAVVWVSLQWVPNIVAVLL